MAPRIILYTGKGGVGKTSVSAATALRAAAKGHRTVVLSTDPAHSLSDSLDVPLSGTPTEIAPRCFAQEVDPQGELERNWTEVQSWLGGVLADRGLDTIVAEELTVPPGLDELFALLEIKRHRESGDYDLIVVDCAPTGETLRLLSFPDVARWWLDKILPIERRLVGFARPFARRMLDVELPGDRVFTEVERLVVNLVAMHDILSDRDRCSVRLVMNPERMVIREAQRTFTYLNLFGFPTDAVVVNRIFPADLTDGYFAAWRDTQQERLREIAEAFAPVPLFTAPFFEQEVIGLGMLGRLADALYDDADPATLNYSGLSHRFETVGDHSLLRLRLPFADRGAIDLKKRGDELFVRVGTIRRTVVLPQKLAAASPREARFEGGELVVAFA
jgi:arsenite-transporting ATPase